MPLGASPPRENRFALLSPGVHSKRKKPNKTRESYPELPPIVFAKTDDPKFIVIKSSEEKKPISNYSCFAVHKAILAISKDIISISELRDGSLLVLTKNKKIAEKFMSSKLLPGICLINVTYQTNLNCVKGTIFAPFLNNLTDSEIVDGLKMHGVIAAYKFQKKSQDTLIPTGAILLSFDSYSLPEKIDVAWRKVSVRPYYPNPMRCKSCQLLGHTLKYCKNPSTCAICSLPPHVGSECSRTMCANCAGDHPSFASNCPKFVQAKEILKIKTINKCSMREAAKKYNASTTSKPSASTFSQIIASTSSSAKSTIMQSKELTTTNNSTTTQSPLATASTNSSYPTYSQITANTAPSTKNSIIQTPKESIATQNSISSHSSTSIASTTSFIALTHPPLKTSFSADSIAKTSTKNDNPPLYSFPNSNNTNSTVFNILNTSTKPIYTNNYDSVSQTQLTSDCDDEMSTVSVLTKTNDISPRVSSD